MIRTAPLLALALLLTVVLDAAAATTKTVTVSNAAFTPAVVSLSLGDSVGWNNTSAKKHNVTSNVNFLWSPVTIAKHKVSTPVAFTQAGTFLYHDALHPKLKGSVAVAPSVTPAIGTAATQFLVTVGSATTPGQFVHEIQVRLNGGPWSPRAAASDQTQTFSSSTPGRWEIQTRLRYLLSGATTGWSPSVSVQVN